MTALFILVFLFFHISPGAAQEGSESLWFALFPPRASEYAARVDALYIFMGSVAGFFSLLIAVLIAVFAVKYHRREGGPPARFVRPRIWLEILWILIPFGFSVVMFLWGAVLYLDTSNPPDGAHTIYVLGRQWMWKVQHPLGAREINELHVPVGRPIKLFITSEDVIHSFFLPSFRIKMDALPGRYTTTWFQANRTGRFHIFCAEYCGSYHAGMIGRVVVMEPAEYADWLSQNNTGRIPLAAGGEELFRRLDCTSCHQAGPLPGGRVRAPNLQGLLGRRVVLTNGRTVTADENYLRESVLNPQAMVVAGYAPIMPSYRGKISEEELVQLIAYIKTLGTQERAP